MPGGVELATAWVRLVPSMDGIQDTITKEMGGAGVEAAGAQAGKQYKKGVGGAVGGLAKIVGGAFIGQQIAGYLQDSVAGLARIETINAQTAAAISATGGAANVTAAEVEALALSIEGATATEAEAVQEGANMLLTFKNLKNEAGAGNDVFDQSVRALTDMSRAMGSDPKTAAIQLGKALNDPIAGISALSRVGVQFTDDQKKLIESLVESGDVMGAQKVILEELNGQFGGSGAAYASTYEGQIALLSDSFGDMGQTLMSALMPALTWTVGFLTQVFTFLGENQGILLAFAGILGVTLVAAFFAWAASIWASTIALLANPVTWIILAIIALIAVIVLLVMNWDTVVAWITEIWGAFIAWIQAVGASFADWWNGFWAGISAWIQSVWDGFTAWVQGVWNGFVGWLQSTGNSLASWWNGLWSGIGSFFAGVWDGIVSSARSAVNRVIGILNGIIGAINNVVNGISGLFGVSVSLPRIPQLADGATIKPRAGGTLAILAEAGRSESVVDTGLMNRALEEGLSGNGSGRGDVTINLINPKPEPASGSLQRAYSKIAYLGLDALVPEGV